MAASERNYDYLFKYVLLGADGVGKSALLARYCDDSFPSFYAQTVGVDFKVKNNVSINGKTIKTQIWDPGRALRDDSSMMEQYSNAVEGIFVVYDITDEASYEAARADVLKMRGKFPGKPILLVGAKADLGSDRVIEAARAEDFAHENNIRFMETSARNNANVADAFAYMNIQVFNIMHKQEVKQAVPARALAPVTNNSSTSSDSYLSRNKFPLLASVGAGGLGGGLATAFLAATAPAWAPYAIGAAVFLLLNLAIFGVDRSRSAGNRNQVERAMASSGTSTGPSHEMHRQLGSRRELKSDAIFTLLVNTINKGNVNITVRPTMTVKEFSALLFDSCSMCNFNGSTVDEFCRMNFFEFNGKRLTLDSSETLEKLGMQHLSKINQVSDVIVQNTRNPSGDQPRPPSIDRGPRQP